jgi:hypothetical protein
MKRRSNPGRLLEQSTGGVAAGTDVWQSTKHLIMERIMMGFPEELEKFCTLDKISLLDKHLRVLLKAAGYLRTQASASHDTSTQVKASPIAVSKNHVLSNC